MPAEKKVTRRTFLIKAAVFVAGCASGATGLFTLWKGKRADPFLSRDSLAVLKRFGLGQDLLDALDLSIAEQTLLARRVQKLIREFDARKSFFRRHDFSRALREAVERDFKKRQVLTAGNWILSKTEVGIYLFNKLQRSGWNVS
jgi:hypothetical protein